MAKRGVLKIATCQFDVSESILENAQWITNLMVKAKEAGASIVHFSECALSGYASVDFFTFEDYNWHALASNLNRIRNLARELEIWVVLGSSHLEGNQEKPFNSLYLIGPDGEIVDRYDKRFCTPAGIEYYSPGEHFTVFEINGVKCSLLICYDLRFPELYRELKKLDVDCIFQSFYNARQTKPSVHTHIMRQTMQCRAATNYFWVSMTNSSAPISPYSSCFIQPDGYILDSMESETAGLIVNTVDLSKTFYDASGPYRDLAMAGKLSNKEKA